MPNNDLLKIQQQKVDNAKNMFADHWNINLIKNKFKEFNLAENIGKAFDLNQS